MTMYVIVERLGTILAVTLRKRDLIMHDDFISQEDFMPYKPMPTSDPAYWMLERGRAEASGAAPDTGWVTKTHNDIYRASCYICRDEEFALMGMPVCKPCPMCGVHWSADDSFCDNGCDVQYGVPHQMQEENNG